MINGQNLNIAIRDLQDESWSINGWTRYEDSVELIDINYQSEQSCQVNLMIVKDQQTLKKTYTITDIEYNIIYIEMEMYFVEFMDNLISITVNQKLIYQNIFIESQLSGNSLCGSNFDPIQTIFLEFYENQATLRLEINYSQINKDSLSFIGIRNINIYTNGIPLLNGCPFDKQFIQVDGSCVEQCNLGCQFLSGPQLRYCTNDITCNSKLLKTYLTSDLNKWSFSTNPPTEVQKQFLNQVSSIYYVNNNNNFMNAMTSSLFDYNFPRTSCCVRQAISTNVLIQIQFAVYIIGEWGDGSSLNIQIFGQNNVKNTGVRIYKSRSFYISTTSSQFYLTNLTDSQGQTVVARKIQITYSANYYSSTVRICFYNIILASGSYGFGDFFIYQAQTIPNVLQQGLYGIINSCAYPYYAYLGTCMLKCPPHSSMSTTSRNCSDYLQAESQIYNPTIKINSLPFYVTKSFYDNNYLISQISKLFQIQPTKYKNQQNGQHYSFINGKKIIGGFGCWGHGTYVMQISQLSPHYQLRIYFNLYLIDDWREGDRFLLIVDGQLINSYTQIKQEQLQGLPIQDQKQIIQQNVIHSSQTAQISFVCNLQAKDSFISSCGLSDITILADRNSDLLCFDVEEYYSYITFQCEPCNPPPCILYPNYNPYTNKCTLGCIDCQSNICVACDYQTGYKLTGTSCVQRDGYYLNIIPRSCSYQCLTCNGSSSNNCQTCDTTRVLSSGKCICKENNVDVFSLKQCQPITSNCHYSCQTCYGLDYYQCVTCDSNQFRQLQILTYTQECQCLTDYYENGQKQCLYQYCHKSCQTCIGPSVNNCFSCIDKVTFVNGYCLCFDNLQQNTERQCIDCNSDIGIIIVECKYANPKDGVWTYGEQCDNGNLLRSGCLRNEIQKNYNCVNTFQQPSICYKCPENCISCEQADGTIICTHCENNYFNSQTSCVKCLQQACQECITPHKCDICFNGAVEQNGLCVNLCEKGYQLIDDQCQPLCCDGIKTKNEQCDDGNLLSFDGCNQYCTIEQNFYCSSELNQQSICYINPQPYLILNQVQSKYQTNIYQFNIQSSQKLFQSNIKVQIKSDIISFIKLEQKVNYQNEQYYYLDIDFNLTFQSSFEITTLQIIISGELLNIYNQTLIQNHFNKTFANINVMNEYQQSINQKLITAGAIAANTLTYSIFPTLLIADFSSAIMLLNLIKQLQYIQYLNIDFPPNLQQFLQLFNGILPLKWMQFDFFDFEISQQRPHQLKFQQFGINSSFINNIIKFFPIVAIGWLLNQLSNVTLLLIFNLLRSQLNNTNYLRIKIFIINIQQHLIKVIKQYRKIQLIEVIQAYQYEITFSIILQISNFQIQSFIGAINWVSAIIILIKYFQMILKQFYHQKMDKQLCQEKKLISIRMFQTLFFQVAIIILQDIPLCQIITISINSFVMFIEIIKYNQIKQKLIRINTFIQELTFSITSLSLLSYIYFPIYIDPISLGWLQIYLFLQMITIILLIQLYQMGQQIKKLFQNK